MLIPLWARAVESKGAPPIIRDEIAVENVSRLPDDFSVLDNAHRSRLGVAIRSALIDDATRCFLQRKPNGILVNLGAGLDTRYARLALDGVRWYDLDVPGAIALQSRFFAETGVHRFLAKIVFDRSWINDIGVPADPILFIAEEKKS